jgi:class 3 adenylate cyclase
MTTRNIVIQYHLLGLLIIINYLFISLPDQTCWDIFPALNVAAVFLLAAEFIFHLQRPLWGNNLSSLKNHSQQFVFQFSFYLFTALAVFLLERYFFNYSLAIVEKSLMAIMTVGFYIAIGITLEIEHDRIKNKITSNRAKTVPINLKLRYFLLLLLSVDWVVFILLYLAHSHGFDYPYITQQELQEIIFVSVVVVSFSIYLFYLYNRNFIQILDIQLTILHSVTEDNFDVNVPILSDDELALLANYHNTMIEWLRERKHLYKTLKKSVGANIMNKLLTTDEQTLKQGELYSVAILFCDLRGFTSLGESASAEEVILFLNDYFADVSSVISQHRGIINKFMGDAVLAIFGLENEGNAVEDAVNASLAIIQHNVDFYMPNELHPETGVGIDFGLVVGGTIGSEDRYEYTIIGDAVNKASRLEGLSKRLSYKIILSEDAYQQLCADMQQYFCNLGEHKVRGRNEPICVYGCGKKQTESTESQPSVAR